MLSLTVIIPTKNRYDALSEALKSIARQTVKPQEIIVVDQTPNYHSGREEAAKLLPSSIHLNLHLGPENPRRRNRSQRRNGERHRGLASVFGR